MKLTLSDELRLFNRCHQYATTLYKPNTAPVVNGVSRNGTRHPMVNDSQGANTQMVKVINNRKLICWGLAVKRKL